MSIAGQPPGNQTGGRMVDLGLTDYASTYVLQLERVEKRSYGSALDDLILVTEHPGTFTLGRRGGREKLMVSEQFLHEKNIPLVHIERGGETLSKSSQTDSGIGVTLRNCPIT